MEHPRIAATSTTSSSGQLEGLSDINNGVLLCVPCHHRLHDYGWIIEVVDGEVWFIPPATTDPNRERIPSCSTRLKLASSATASV